MPEFPGKGKSTQLRQLRGVHRRLVNPGRTEVLCPPVHQAAPTPACPVHYPPTRSVILCPSSIHLPSHPGIHSSALHPPMLSSTIHPSTNYHPYSTTHHPYI